MTFLFNFWHIDYKGENLTTTRTATVIIIITAAEAAAAAAAATTATRRISVVHDILYAFCHR